MAINKNQVSDFLQPTTGRVSLMVGSSTINAATNTGGLALLYAYTTGTTPVNLGYDPTGLVSAGSTPTGLFTIPNTTAMYVQGMLIATRSGYISGDTTEPVGIFLEALVARGTSAATTQLIGTPIKTKKFGSSNGSIGTASVAISPDTSNGALQIQVTGEFATPYYWTCLLQWVRSGHQ